jgi:hypothetical protein
MLRNLWKPVLAALAVVVPVADVPSRPAAAAVAAAENMGIRLGPYATIRRANEVANEARRLGYNARVIPIHALGGYFVDVW